MTRWKSTKTSMKKIIILAMITSTAYCLIGTSQASEAEQHKGHAIEEHSGLQISNDLKVVLNQEMNGIEEGMMKIIPAIAAGDWETIAHIAQKIKNSFILKQKLTQEQIEELHHSLPAEFIEMDHGFHATAGKLAHAAHQHDVELVNFYFYKLHSQCTKCHSKYASERFSNFKKNQHEKGEHH